MVEQPLDALQGEITQMFVVNGVVVQALQDSLGVMDFNRQRSLFMQHRAQAVHEVMGVRDMGKHVAGDDDMRRPMFGPHLFRRFPAPEGAHRGNPPLPGHLGDVGCRIDAKHPKPIAQEGRQKSTVITGGLQDIACFRLPRTRDDFLVKPSRILLSRAGGAGHPYVMGKQFLRVRRVVQLDQVARRAPAQRQGVGILFFIRTGQQRIRKRLHAQVKKRFDVATLANAASGDVLHKFFEKWNEPENDGDLSIYRETSIVKAKARTLWQRGPGM